jgi:F0F1-type ATP synthase assembly protein I
VALRRGPEPSGVRAGRGAEVAWEAALSMVLGALLGMWIDSKTGTTPLFLVIFLALGLAAAVRRLLQFANAQARADAEAAKTQPAPPPERFPDEFEPRDRDEN